MNGKLGKDVCSAINTTRSTLGSNKSEVDPNRSELSTEIVSAIFTVPCVGKGEGGCWFTT